MTVEVRRGTHRFVTREEGRSTRHSFSFGEHYDPENVGFGPMVCHDDHLLRGDAGFPEHQHAELEIVTWVLSGALHHRASVGEAATLGPGEVGVLSAGAGVVHSELAVPDAGPTRFLQTWLRPDDSGAPPSYSHARVNPGRGDLVTVVSGRPGAAPVTVGARAAALHVATLDSGQSVTLPDDPLQHVFVATGSLTRSSLAEPLSAGDAFRVTDRPGLTVTAASPTELLVWSFAAR